LLFNALIPLIYQRKINVHDKNEVPKEIVQLGSSSHFGEIALITEEPRSATVTVISDTAKCLRMTKAKFEGVFSVTKQLMAESRTIIGKDVIDKVPLFKSLTAINRTKLLEAMQSVTFNSGSYICRQGTMGNTFYIITDGCCRVTLNTDDFTEKEVNKMYAGDFFGEPSDVSGLKQLLHTVAHTLLTTRYPYHR
jgi:CRP-like cAMP-binding protein